MNPTLLAALALTILSNFSFAADDIVIADFERADYGDWKSEGEAFGTVPAQGTLPNQMTVSGYQGHGLANSFNKGDGSTGTLTSPEFKIERSYINFLIGGGKLPEKACLNLRLDGQVVRSATGPNDRPGGTEALHWESWDVHELLGKAVSLQIVDQAIGGWGHIMVDQITQSEQKKVSGPVSRELTVNQPYLWLPVKNGAPGLRMKFEVDGKAVREFVIEYASEQPDFYAFSNVSAFMGKTLKVSGVLPDASNAFSALKLSDTLPGENVYHEKLRPQFHFSSRVGWLNDPNGLVYHNGEYHLFYQHNPFGWKWGNMHWGHAVSSDLLHWKEQPEAIYPHRWDDWAFSGSAITDTRNTSGFKQGDSDVLIAAYTSTGRGECICYSNDNGQTFTEFEGNPVVKHAGRDPKLIWYAPTQSWVMVVYDEFEKKQWIAFYKSPDLKAWTFQSRVEGYFECPEFFELPVDGDAKNTRWVLYAANGMYALGKFDGKQFTPEGAKIKFSHGNCFYASQTFNGMPEQDGRRLQIGWGQCPTPGMAFNQCMLFPSELTLRNTPEGVRLYANPAREIEKLRGKTSSQKDLIVKDGTPLAQEINSELLYINAEFEIGTAQEFGLLIHGEYVRFDASKNELHAKGGHGSLKPENGRIQLRILVDRSSVEIFANGGCLYMPCAALYNAEKKGLSIFSKGGDTKLLKLDVHELKSVWE